MRCNTQRSVQALAKVGRRWAAFGVGEPRSIAAECELLYDISRYGWQQGDGCANEQKADFFVATLRRYLRSRGVVLMTYQGERARPMQSEIGRFFEVSKVRVATDGHVSDVLWSEVDAASDRYIGARVLATAAEVVDALHDGARVAAVFSSTNSHLPERPFVVVAHEDGRECIAFAGASSPGRNLSDIDSLDGQVHGADAAEHREQPATRPRDRTSRSIAGRRMATFAVSKVRLDPGGRVTDVLWGRVDTGKNAWAAPEVMAPVAEAVQALDAGDRVFALFPSVNGHLPDRRFVAVDYDDGRRTIVLDGPTAFEREVHDMDRLD